MTCETQRHPVTPTSSASRSTAQPASSGRATTCTSAIPPHGGRSTTGSKRQPGSRTDA